MDLVSHPLSRRHEQSKDILRHIQLLHLIRGKLREPISAIQAFWESLRHGSRTLRLASYARGGFGAAVKDLEAQRLRIHHAHVIHDGGLAPDAQLDIVRPDLSTFLGRARLFFLGHTACAEQV